MLWRNLSLSVVVAFSLACFVESVEVLRRMSLAASETFLEVYLDVMFFEMLLPVVLFESCFCRVAYCSFGSLEGPLPVELF